MKPQPFSLHSMRNILILLFISFFSGACGSDQAEVMKKIRQEMVLKSEAQIAATRQMLDAGSLRNAVVLKSYAEVLEKEKPELAELTRTIKAEATSKSPHLKRFEERLAESKKIVNEEKPAPETVADLESLFVETVPENYNDSLIDSINVLADLSGGKLSRLSAPPKKESLAKNNAQDFGQGSQYIGNPRYGSWQQDSSGNMIWQWIGAYALFSTLNNNRSFGFDDWNRNRDWNYYRDVGNYRTRSTYRTYGPQGSYGNDSGYGSSSKSYGDMSRERRQSSFGGPRSNSQFSPSRSSSSAATSSDRRSSSFASPTTSSSSSSSSGNRTSSFSSSSSRSSSSGYSSSYRSSSSSRSSRSGGK